MSQTIADRIEARKLAQAMVARMQEAGKWEAADAYHAEQIAPLNEWLEARGVW